MVMLVHVTVWDNHISEPFATNVMIIHMAV